MGIKIINIIDELINIRNKICTDKDGTVSKSKRLELLEEQAKKLGAEVEAEIEIGKLDNFFIKSIVNLNFLLLHFLKYPFTQGEINYYITNRNMISIYVKLASVNGMNLISGKRLTLGDYPRFLWELFRHEEEWKAASAEDGEPILATEADITFEEWEAQQEKKKLCDETDTQTTEKRNQLIEKRNKLKEKKAILQREFIKSYALAESQGTTEQFSVIQSDEEKQLEKEINQINEQIIELYNNTEE